MPNAFKNYILFSSWTSIPIQKHIFSLLSSGSQTTHIYPNLHCRRQVTCLRSPSWLGGRVGFGQVWVTPSGHTTSDELTNSFPGMEMFGLLSASIDTRPSLYSSSYSEQKEGLPLRSPSLSPGWVGALLMTC